MPRCFRVLPLLLVGCATTDPAVLLTQERDAHRQRCRMAIEGGETPKGCEKVAADMAADLAEERAAAEEERKRREADPVGYCLKDATFEYETCVESTETRAREQDRLARTVFQQQVIATRAQNEVQQCGARQSAEIARCQTLPRPPTAPQEVTAPQP